MADERPTPKVLVTLLGRTNKGGYDKVQYRFADGDVRPAAFLGWPLMERLKPVRMIVLGTATSFWDHLFEGDLDLGEAGENRRLALIEATEAGEPIDQSALNQLAPLLERTFGREIRLIIIPVGVDSADQMMIVEALERHVPDECELHLDCTHGFRHMPMILLAAGQFLEGTGRVSGLKVHYGRQEANDRASVFELHGLTHLQTGVNALAIYDRSGDFEPVLEFLDRYLPIELDREQIREAAFQERILRIPAAKRAFRDLHRLLTTSELPFPARLLQRELAERVAWANEPAHHRRQINAARRALTYGDYLRAAPLLYESVINYVVHAHDLGDAENREVRECARARVRKQERRKLLSFDLLNRVRNSLLHAVRPVGADAQQLIASPSKLSEFLSHAIDEIEHFIND